MSDYVISSGNVFQDLALAKPSERLAKAKLASIINDLYERRELTLKEAVKLLGIGRQELSDLQNGRLKEFSMERLFSLLEALEQQIVITVTDKARVNSIFIIKI
jgi:predicted XRE-type DNA-binding protein